MDKLLELNNMVPYGVWSIEGKAVVTTKPDGTKQTVLPVACGLLGSLNESQRKVLEFLIEAHNTLPAKLEEIVRGSHELADARQELRRERWRMRSDAVRK